MLRSRCAGIAAGAIDVLAQGEFDAFHIAEEVIDALLEHFGIGLEAARVGAEEAAVEVSELPR